MSVLSIASGDDIWDHYDKDPSPDDANESDDYIDVDPPNDNDPVISNIPKIPSIPETNSSEIIQKVDCNPIITNFTVQLESATARAINAESKLNLLQSQLDSANQISLKSKSDLKMLRLQLDSANIRALKSESDLKSLQSQLESAKSQALKSQSDLELSYAKVNSALSEALLAKASQEKAKAETKLADSATKECKLNMDKAYQDLNSAKKAAADAESKAKHEIESFKLSFKCPNISCDRSFNDDALKNPNDCCDTCPSTNSYLSNIPATDPILDDSKYHASDCSYIIDQSNNSCNCTSAVDHFGNILKTNLTNCTLNLNLYSNEVHLFLFF